MARVTKRAPKFKRAIDYFLFVILKLIQYNVFQIQFYF